MSRKAVRRTPKPTNPIPLVGGPIGPEDEKDRARLLTPEEVRALGLEEVWFISPVPKRAPKKQPGSETPT